jgi:transposase
MRKSFDGLGGIVNKEMGKYFLKGDGSIFVNKRRTLIKILVWDGTGQVIYHKNLSSVTLELPEWNEAATSTKHESFDISMMVEGVQHKQSE